MPSQAANQTFGVTAAQLAQTTFVDNVHNLSHFQD
jgi:hypothetical protein